MRRRQRRSAALVTANLVSLCGAAAAQWLEAWVDEVAFPPSCIDYGSRSDFLLHVSLDVGTWQSKRESCVEKYSVGPFFGTWARVDEYRPSTLVASFHAFESDTPLKNTACSSKIGDDCASDWTCRWDVNSWTSSGIRPGDSGWKSCNDPKYKYKISVRYSYPTISPSRSPTRPPSARPTRAPTPAPTQAPTQAPSLVPTLAPTLHACDDGSHGCHNLSAGGVCIRQSTAWTCACRKGYWCSAGCAAPRLAHRCTKITDHPTVHPSLSPTFPPSRAPTMLPSLAPSESAPTVHPSLPPSHIPSVTPSGAPTTAPTGAPNTTAPTAGPSSSSPTMLPTGHPSHAAPTLAPTAAPTVTPSSAVPTAEPSTQQPSQQPSPQPATAAPSGAPTGSPSRAPREPTEAPSERPSAVPTPAPTFSPTSQPDPGLCLLTMENTTCDDGNPATVNDTCVSGLCTGVVDRCAGRICRASDSCHVAGSCDPVSGLCSDPNRAEGFPCDDADESTAEDSCHDGRCRGTMKCEGVKCTPCDAGCSIVQCAPHTGKCKEQSKPDGTACNDADGATTGDRCVQGLCIGTPDRCAGTVCVRASQCHTVGVCDPYTGLCSKPIAPAGTPCDDQLPETEGDACFRGGCVGQLRCGGLACNASQGGLFEAQCHAPACSEEQVCSVPSRRADGWACVDPTPNTRDGRCVLGHCTGEPDLCAGVRCPAPLPCHGAALCNASTGECGSAPLADGVRCDDNDPDTRGGSCAAGRCAGVLRCPGAKKDCLSPESRCHRAACEGSECIVLVRDCVPCSDGDPATASDTCRGGVCKGGVVNGTRRPPIPGHVFRDSDSRAVVPAGELDSGPKIELVVTVTGDRVLDLGGAAVPCGAAGSPDALVWLSGTREKVVDACTAERLSPTKLAVFLRPSEGLAPGWPEILHVSLQPGLMRSGEAPRGAATFKLNAHPPKHRLLDAPPVIPGVASLALKMQMCSEEPEEELELVISPFRLKAGSKEMGAYQGALFTHLCMGAVPLLGAGGLLAHLTKADRDRVRVYGGAPLGLQRRLSAARFGSIIYILTFTYPSSAYVASVVLWYGDGPAFQVIAAAALLAHVAFPVYIIFAVRQVEDFATTVSCDEEQTALEWLFDGTEWWAPLGKWYRYWLYHLLYASFKLRDRYLLAAELTLTLVLAVLQSVHPQSEVLCKTLDGIALALMASFALYVTVRRSYLAPYEMFAAAVVLWGEVATKALLISQGYGHSEDHWAVLVATAFGKVLGGIFILQSLIGLGTFVRDEYDHWCSIPGGGNEVSEKEQPLRFARYWFFFHRCTNILFGGTAEELSAQQQRSSSIPPPPRVALKKPPSPELPGAELSVVLTWSEGSALSPASETPALPASSSPSWRRRRRLQTYFWDEAAAAERRPTACAPSGPPVDDASPRSNRQLGARQRGFTLGGGHLRRLSASGSSPSSSPQRGATHVGRGAGASRTQGNLTLLEFPPLRAHSSASNQARQSGSRGGLVRNPRRVRPARSTLGAGSTSSILDSVLVSPGGSNSQRGTSPLVPGSRVSQMPPPTPGVELPGSRRGVRRDCPP
eukprot:TRINITY_DN32772_c0_g1_i2.p1 TRINITY_DN32772_c0_g1~~TRINITY_DN32772_c0_g1_i2.p1  ORF type:complete len:1567 (+),score=181.96 TRINITY_DN32772_c0_g1_i2:59-4759(+)